MFTHLHLHTEFSLLDGAIHISAIAQKVLDLGQNAVAITDHGWIAGAVDFSKACKEKDVKPIIGSEIYVATTPDHKTAAKSPGDNYHLTLLSASPEGYANLRRLSSLAHLEGMSFRPRISKALLRDHSEGLILLSGCVAAELPQLLARGHEKKASKLVEWYQKTFGDRFFIELMAHGSTGGIDHVRVDEGNEVLMYETELNEALVYLARQHGIGIVATNDAHYLERDHGDAHDTLLCLAVGSWKDAESRLAFPGSKEQAWEFYVKSEEEMRGIGSAHDFWLEACDNTAHIASMVADSVVPMDNTLLPKFEIQRDPKYEWYRRMGEFV